MKISQNAVTLSILAAWNSTIEMMKRAPHQEFWPISCKRNAILARSNKESTNETTYVQKLERVAGCMQQRVERHGYQHQQRWTNGEEDQRVHHIMTRVFGKQTCQEFTTKRERRHTLMQTQRRDCCIGQQHLIERALL